jgi:prepilin-type N-terminal cleavage/methylation domain-containing protein
MGYRRRAFTLVELLVVVGIISVLIALLFPVLTRARRQFIVLACPIAVVGEDGALYLVSPNGNAEMRLTEPGLVVQSTVGLRAAVQWSPCGRRIGFNAYDRVAGREYTVFMEPMANQVWKYEGQRFGGFIDYDTWLETGAWGHQVRSVVTGRPVDRFSLPDDRHYDTFAPAPPSSGGAFVASWHGDIRPCIGLVNKNYQPGAAIYTWPEADRGQHYHLNPQVDPTGQWAGWQGPLGGSGAFVRGLREGPAAPLVALPGNFTFSDWTEDSQVLVTGYYADGANGLAVLKVDGSLVRTIPTDIRAMRGAIAAYRKFGHR